MSQGLPNSSLPNSQAQGSPQASTPTPPTHPKTSMFSKEIIVALIGAAAVIVSAIIAGIFTLEKSSPSSLISPTTTSSFSMLTPSPSPNVYPPVGWKLVYSDPMKSNSSGYWHVSAHGLAGNEGICTFANDVYQVNKRFFPPL